MYVYKSTVAGPLAAQSFGHRLCNVEYRDERKAESLGIAASVLRSLPETRPTPTKLLLHAVLLIILPYLHRRLQRRATLEQWEFAEDPRSWKRRLAMWLNRAETFVTLLSTINFVVFLWDGRYVTAVDRLLGLRLVQGSQRMSRTVNVEFMNQQIFWSALFSFMSFVLPLLNLGKWWSAAWRQGADRRRHSGEGDDDLPLRDPPAFVQRQLAAHTACPLCSVSPMAQPRPASPCGHVCCYYCIAERTVNGGRFACPRCGQDVTGVMAMPPTTSPPPR